jgi:hypothetical protein
VDFNLYIESESPRTVFNDSVSLYWNANFFIDRKTFTSIPHSFWWAFITMTAVGYGDMYPLTEWGYVIGSLTALSGLLMIGFSVPILINNFIMYYQHIQFGLEEEKLKRNTSRKWTLMTLVEDIDKKISAKNNNSYC